MCTLQFGQLCALNPSDPRQSVRAQQQEQQQQQEEQQQEEQAGWMWQETGH